MDKDRAELQSEPEVYETPLLVDLEEATGFADICYTGGGCGEEVPV